MLNCAIFLLVCFQLSSAMKAEFASVSWDTELQSSLEGNLLKTLKYIGVKVEQYETWFDQQNNSFSISDSCRSTKRLCD